jgi:hypothetical protein
VTCNYLYRLLALVISVQVGDVRDLRDIAGDATFGGVLDKGTLDALMCEVLEN